MGESKDREQPVTYYDLRERWIDPAKRLSRWNENQKDVLLWLNDIFENFPQKPEDFDFTESSENRKRFNITINKKLAAVNLPTLTLPETVAEDTCKKLTKKIKTENRQKYLLYYFNLAKYLYYVAGLQREKAYQAIDSTKSTSY